MIKQTHLNHVTTLVISRLERRNALNWATIRELADGISNAEADPDCRCLVITGDGDHFVAGRDLDEAKSDASLKETLANDEAYTRIFTALRSMSKPSVSVVRGYAVAGGFTLAVPPEVEVSCIPPDAPSNITAIVLFPQSLFCYYYFYPTSTQAVVDSFHV